jgi:hypothetical protein
MNPLPCGREKPPRCRRSVWYHCSPVIRRTRSPLNWIDKNSLWGGLNIQKKELCVNGILAQDLGFIWRPFQRGSGDFRGKRSTRQETVYYCMKCFIEGRNSEITLSGKTFHNPRHTEILLHLHSPLPLPTKNTKARVMRPGSFLVLHLLYLCCQNLLP